MAQVLYSSPEKQAHFCDLVADELNQQSDFLTPTRIDGVLRNLALKLYPAQERESAGVWKSADTTLALKDVWKARAAMLGYRPIHKTMSTIFRAWLLVHRFESARKALRKRCRAERRVYWDKHLSEAEEALQANNSYGFYSIIRRFAPKQSYTRIQIRDKDGALQTSTREAQCIDDFWRPVFEGDGLPSLPQVDKGHAHFSIPQVDTLRSGKPPRRTLLLRALGVLLRLLRRDPCVNISIVAIGTMSVSLSLGLTKLGSLSSASLENLPPSHKTCGP